MVAISKPRETLSAFPLVIIGPDTANSTMAAITAGANTLAWDNDGACANDHIPSLSERN